MSSVSHRFRRVRLLAAIEGFNERALEAWTDYVRRTGEKLSDTEIAKRMAKPPGEKPLASTSVGAWMEIRGRGSEPRNLKTTAAFARVLGVRAGWLAFGEPPKGPTSVAIPDPDQRRPRVTRAEVDRRKRKVEDAETGEKDQVEEE